MFIFDAHLDLSMNAMEWNPDLTWSAEEIRESEKGMTDKPDRFNNTVSFEAMRKGNIGTDLDGGFGKEQGSIDLDTIADLQKVPDLLLKRGYSSLDIENIMSQNFIRFLQNTWQ